jgi:hypothetical protein
MQRYQWGEWITGSDRYVKENHLDLCLIGTAACHCSSLGVIGKRLSRGFVSRSLSA